MGYEAFNNSCMDVFLEATKRIERAYQDLGHQLGWRFLYSPISTLSRETQMLLVGSAPGGKHYDLPIASVEEGNAYRVEAWGAGGEPAPLQIQVRSLFGIISSKLEQRSASTLIDETLTSNFCPFRALSWELLHRREDSISFSAALWLFLFEYISPKVVLCLGSVPFEYFGNVLLEQRFRIMATSIEPVGWGTVTYSQSTYRSGDKEILMIRIPELSRFKIIGRPESQKAVDDFTDELVGALWDDARRKDLRRSALSRHFTHYWKNYTWDRDRERTLSGASGLLEHAADNRFLERGVQPRDFVYPVTIREGMLYVMCKLEVGTVCDFDEAARILGTTDLWEADDHIIAATPAPKHFDLAVPLETTRQLRFVSGNTTEPLKFKSNTSLDQ